MRNILEYDYLQHKYASMQMSDSNFVQITTSDASKRQNKNLYYSISFMSEYLGNFIHNTHYFKISYMKTLF